MRAGLAVMDLIEETYRVPLVPMKPENRAKLEWVFRREKEPMTNSRAIRRGYRLQRRCFQGALAEQKSRKVRKRTLRYIN